MAGRTAVLNGSSSSGNWSAAGRGLTDEADDGLVGRTVAIKVLAPASAGVGGFGARFRGVARAAVHFE